ncbi:hypothetical protein [Microvirgula aerodenitrificans]|uniref:hypothetical protein n=1 Tax=Microvirgula aerodenitrificans TaxID=57480 RepID=UPI00248F407B|nr:hypothetical protein [Microvirgula aerodenitrificans]
MENKVGCILSKTQASAIYDAICVLNRIGARIHTTVENDGESNFILVFEGKDGKINARVIKEMFAIKREIFTDQSEFATAYGLNAV